LLWWVERAWPDEQRTGITLARVQEIAEALLHPAA
jgi:hypothetical protein